jgi:Holliday junction resolvase YEN1
VFDGPNKPLFKRNKKVGGPGVRVASVPEFLAKQLLKQFGFPWHVAPGEAEAECALLQREGIVDAVLSEDVDTLMFGSGVTLRNWTSDSGSNKTPTHVNVYRAEDTLKSSGLDGQGMVLVALMSGGDYIPEGIPGCGPKVACDAARAGFGKELCSLRKTDKEGLKAWRDRLQHEIRTNESKFFTRKSKALVIPDDFPSAEVLGYYTRPCISSATKVAQLRESLKWDQEIDFPALRSFTGDAFDWRFLGGAKKFIRNLAPAMLVQRLRLVAEAGEDLEQEAQAKAEAALVNKIHSKRTHNTTDGELELRISFTPSNLVPIDLDMEDEEDDFLLAGQDENDSEPDDDVVNIPSETPTEASDAEEGPTSPTKKPRQAKPYDPNVDDKLWILKDFLQLGCPLLVEDYEASLRDPKETVKNKRKATAAANAGLAKIHAPKARAPRKTKASKPNDMPTNTLMRHMQVTKATSLPPLSPARKEDGKVDDSDDELPAVPGFRLPTTRVPSNVIRKPSHEPQPVHVAQKSKEREIQRTPKKSNKLKRPSQDFSTPRAGRGRDIMSYFSPTPKAKRTQSQGDLADDGNKDRSAVEVIDLLSSSPMQDAPRDPSPTPRQTRFEDVDDVLPPLPSTVTKRRKTRRERGPLRKSLSAPVHTSSPLFMPMYDGTNEMDMGFDAEIDASVEEPEHQWPSPDRTPHEHDAAAPTCAQVPPAPFFGFPSSQHSLPTPPAEILSSPAPQRREPDHSGDAREGGFIRELSAEGYKATSPPPSEKATIAPRPAAAAAAKAVPETITLSSSPMAAPPQPPQNRLSPPPSRPNFSRPALARSVSTSSTATSASTSTSAPSLPQQRPPSRPQPEANNPVSNPISNPISNPTAKSNPKQKPKAKAIILRPSLPGTWRAATDEEAEALDLTGDGSGVRASYSSTTTNATKRGGSRSIWRTSGVEVLDLTGSQ